MKVESSQASAAFLLGSSIDSIGIVGNTKRAGVPELAREITRLAAGREIPVALDEGLTEALAGSAGPGGSDSRQVADCALLITLGGDGTLLYAAREHHPFQAPVLAVNMGNLGFNTQAGPDDALAVLEELLDGQAPVEPRLLLDAELVRGGAVVERLRALNDFVLTKTLESRVVHLDCSVGGEPACQYVGDGLVLATPTGSTAYNLATGGPVIHPALEVVSLTPLCPTRMGVNPLVVPAALEIQIEWRAFKDREAVMAIADGQHSLALQEGDRLRVTGAAQPLRLVLNHRRNYFRTLHEKIGWGGNPT